jgi:uncharacterized protein
MYPTAQESAVIEAAEKMMVDTMARYDPSHDAYHGERDQNQNVGNMLMYLMSSSTTCSENCFDDRAECRYTTRSLGRGTRCVGLEELRWHDSNIVHSKAALLHDVLDKKYVTPEEAADPYNFFLPFFASMASKHRVDLIQDGRGQLITQIIDNVSWSSEKELRAKGLWTKWHDECVELHCVQDADRLDAIGAFGMCKSLTTPPLCELRFPLGILRCAAYSAVTNR